MAITRYVDGGALISGDGTSWTNAYKTLSECMDEVVGIDLSVNGTCTVYCRGNVGGTGQNRVLTASSSTNYLLIKGDPDYAYTKGKWDTAAPTIDGPTSGSTDYYGVVDVNGALAIEDMQLLVQTSETTGRRNGTFTRGGDYFRVERCFFRAASTAGVRGDGIRVDHANAGDCIIVNNVVHGRFPKGIYARGDTKCVVYNNTVVGDGVDMAYCYDLNSAGTNVDSARLINNLAKGSATEDYRAVTRTASLFDYNASEDATADTGAGSRINQTYTFTDEANLDFTLTSADTGAKDHGTDLSADSFYAFSVDIAGTTRSAWDIGAHEVVASSTLVPNEATHSHTVDAVTLGVGLVPAEAAHSHTVDAVVLGVGLVPAETSHAHSVDSPTFTDFGLAVSDGQHTHAVDNLGLGMKLAPNEATHALRGEATTVSPVIGAAETRHTVTTEGITFTQFGLAVQEATHANLLDSPAVSGHNSVAPAETTVGHSVDSPTIAINLLVQDGQHGHTVDSPTFTDLGLAVQESSHALTSDHVKVNSLSVQDADHAHSVDGGLAIVVDHTLIAFPYPLHEHTVDEVAISPGYVLAVQDSAHSHLLDAPTITSTYQLSVAGATHAHTADGDVAVSMFFGLKIPRTRHLHRVDSLLIFNKDVQIPLERLLIVQAQDRVMVVEAENRVMRVNAEDRYMTVKSANRSMTVR